MTPLLWGALILVIAAVAIVKAPRIIGAVSVATPIVTQPSVAPSETEARVQRLVRLLDLIKELDAVGAKAAASKLKAAAATLIDEDFLKG